MIYLTFEMIQKDQKQAGEKARNKLLSLFSIYEDEYTKAENGKPYIKNGRAGISVSHSDDIAICVLRTDEELYNAPDDVTVIFEQSNSVEIGCDIEAINTAFPEEKMKKISKRFLGFESCTPREFYRSWTRGEAYGKFTGVGITYADKIPHDTTFYCFEIDINNKKYSLSICIGQNNSQ